MLAEFSRAGLAPQVLPAKSGQAPDCQIELDGLPMFVEIRHRGLSFGMQIYQRLTSAIAFSTWQGAIRVSLATDIGASGERIGVIVNEIAQEVWKLTSIGSTDEAMIRKVCHIEYDADLAERSVQVSWGPDINFIEEIGRNVYEALEDKIGQLQSYVNNRQKCLIACDFRALAPAIPAYMELYRDYPVVQIYSNRRQAVLFATRRFLVLPPVTPQPGMDQQRI